MSTATKKPLILPLNADAIPAELRALDAWIGWRLAFRQGRWTKEPINLRTCALAETDNPRTWLDFDTALFRYAAFRCNGIGLCRTQDQVFIDLDGVLDSAGDLKPFPWASKILSTIQGRAYVERSPTGTGIHGISLGKLPDGRRQFDDPYLDHTGFAFYDKNRFFTFTGHAFPESGPISELTTELGALHHELFPPRAESRNGESAPPPSSLPPSVPLSDDDLIKRAMGARNGTKFTRLWQGDFPDYPSQSEADLALCCHLAFWTGRDAGRIDDLFRRSALYREDKWGTRQDYRERTIDLAIERTNETWQPGMNSGSKIGGAETGTSTTKGKKHESGNAYPGWEDYHNGEFRAGTPGSDFGYPPGGEDIGWEPPIDFLCRNPRPFPEDLLPGFLGGQVRAVARATETPIALAGMLGIAVASACIAGRVEVCAETGYVEPTNLYMAPAMESGNRKTAVLNAMRQPLVDFERAEAERLAPEIARATSRRKTTEAHIAILRKRSAKSLTDETIREIEKLEADLPEIPPHPRLWTQDVTPEKLAAMMAEQDERLALFSDEGGIFDILAGRYSNGTPNLDLFLQAHAGSAVRVDRKSGPPLILQHPLLTVGISPQPDVLQALKDKPGFRGRGVLARFLYGLPASSLGYRSLTPAPVPPEVERTYQRGIHALLSLKGLVRLELSPKAYESWKAFQRGIEVMMREDGKLYHLLDWASKLPGAALRISGVLHMVLSVEDGRGPLIEEDAIEPSLNLATLLIDHALAVFDLMQRDKSVEDALSVLAWIREHKKNTFTQRECFCAKQSRFRRVDALLPALTLLEQHRFIRPAPTDKVDHRPSKKFLVNPGTHGASR